LTGALAGARLKADPSGLVFFDHPGPVRNGPVPPRFAAPNSYFIWELFQVTGGVIRHIEAIMAMFPYGMRPGW
jgi:hypothetical protein